MENQDFEWKRKDDTYKKKVKNKLWEISLKNKRRPLIVKYYIGYMC